jgi:hypothetical protein
MVERTETAKGAVPAAHLRTIDVAGSSGGRHPLAGGRTARRLCRHAPHHAAGYYR